MTEKQMNKNKDMQNSIHMFSIPSVHLLYAWLENKVLLLLSYQSVDIVEHAMMVDILPPLYMLTSPLANFLLLHI